MDGRRETANATHEPAAPAPEPSGRLPEDKVQPLFQLLRSIFPDDDSLRNFIRLHYADLFGRVGWANLETATLAFVTCLQSDGVTRSLGPLLLERTRRDAEIHAIFSDLPPRVPEPDHKPPKPRPPIVAVVAAAVVVLALGGISTWYFWPDDPRILLVCLDDGGATDNPDRFNFSIDGPSGPWIPLSHACVPVSTGPLLSQIGFAALRQIPAARPFLHESEPAEHHRVSRLPDPPAIYCQDTWSGAEPCPTSGIPSGCDPVSEREELHLCVIPFETCCR